MVVVVPRAQGNAGPLESYAQSPSGLQIEIIWAFEVGGDRHGLRSLGCLPGGSAIGLSAVGNPAFTEQPKVINGASDLLVQVFGDCGKHARSAVGVSSLIFDIAVEIEMIVELR